MSNIAATLGIPAEFSWKGGALPVHSADYEVCGLFQRYLEKQALRAIEAHKDELGVVDYAMQMEGWRRECAAGVYGWDGLESWQARQNSDGKKHLMALRLSKGSPRMSLSDCRDIVEEAYEDQKGAWKRLLAAAEQADMDPNRPRPWKRAQPAPA